MNPSEYEHPEWQKKRLEVMEYAQFKCQCCGAKDNPLNVHHVNYDQDKPLWNYKFYEFRCLCETCHQHQHELIRLFRSIVSRLDNKNLNQFRELFSGMNCVQTHSLSEVIPLLVSIAEKFLQLEMMKEEDQQ